jgi:hypothetical protein
MARSASAARLTEGHRLAQARLGAQTASQLLAAWNIIDPADLDETTDAWLRVVLPILSRQKAISAQLAASYYATHRAAELGSSVPAFRPVPAVGLDADRATASMLITGPGHVRAATARGANLVEASDLGNAGSARAGLRHALAGGRETILGGVQADSRALGWARAASGNTCAFCAMLAGRGPVYSEGAADFEAHDGCACQAEPVYSRDAPWPAGSERYREQWEEATAGLSGDEAIAAFRQSLD